jgi:hypothetical protein
VESVDCPGNYISSGDVVLEKLFWEFFHVAICKNTP